MSRSFSIIVLCVLIPLHVILLTGAADDYLTHPEGEETVYVLPSAVLKLASGEFDGLMADFMFLRTLVFMGRTMERTEEPKVKEWEWKRVVNDLNSATDLDPHFYDPYNYGQSLLTWEADMVTETNSLLMKGREFRDWDWMMPFYLGFNYFYFLQDNATASEYLMEASRLPGSMPLLTSLATRLAVKGKRTENAILFMIQLIKTEEDETKREEYITRLDALRSILLLEQAVALYVDRFGVFPKYLEDLLEQELISEIPLDPYGGEFYVDESGDVKVTSNLHRKF